MLMTILHAFSKTYFNEKVQYIEIMNVQQRTALQYSEGTQICTQTSGMRGKLNPKYCCFQLFPVAFQVHFT